MTDLGATGEQFVSLQKLKELASLEKAKLTAGVGTVPAVPPLIVTKPAALQFTVSSPMGVWADEAVDISDDLPQEEEEVVALTNVKPVTGMTPAQIATELRLLIRDKIRGNLKKPTSTTSKYVKQYREGEVMYINQLVLDLDELVEMAKMRKPSLIKQRVLEIKAGSIYALRTNAQRHHESMGAPPPTPVALMQAADRAYALVQALPTIDSPTLGKAEQTLRAMTAIIKVYYGVDIDATAEKLPDVMHDLLLQIKADPVAAPVPAVTSNDPGEPPYTIHTGNGSDLLYNWTLEQMSPQGYGYHGDGEGSYQLWNGGHCSFEQAFKTLVYAKTCFSDISFSLWDSSGKTVAVVYNDSPAWLSQIEQEVASAPF